MTTEPRDLAWLERQFESLIELDDDSRAEALARIECEDPAAARKLRSMLTADLEYQHGGDDAPEPVLPIWTAKLPDIPGYRLFDLAGSGGMGQVYRAVREDDAQQVVRAVKVLRQADAHPLARERFEAECKVLAALDHPGIARYIASGISETGQAYVVMEYIDGEPIDSWCDRQRLGLSQRVELIRSLLAAVQHAHQRLIVHRDIKAGNVLVDGQGRLSLVDFGIAKQLSGEPDMASTATAARFLSLLSAAPEQLTGEPVSTATDVYAIGLLLYRLLCGHDPFAEGENLSPLEFQRRVIDIPPPTLTSRLGREDAALAQARGYAAVSELQRDLRGDLASVVLRCLRKAPADRYASVGALDRDLQNVLEGLPISERESEPAYRVRKFISRHRGKVAAVSIAVLVLCGALVTALSQRASALRERDRAEAVIGVLKDAFAAANPLSTGGGETRVREVLDAAAPMLQQIKSTQPDVFIELAATMAEVELSAGRASAAMALTNEALALQAQQLDPDTPLAARLRRLDAQARLDAGKFDGLQPLIDQIDAPDVHAEIERTLMQGRFAYLQNDVSRAIELLTHASERATLLPPEDPLLLQVDLNLAQAYRLAEKDQEAASQLDVALARLLALHEPDHPKVLLARMRQLEFAQRTRPVDGLLDDARALLDEVDRVFGANSEPAARLSGLLAFLHSRSGRTKDSIEHFRRSWQAWTNSTSPGHPNSLRALFNLIYMTGRSDASTDEVLALYRRLFDDARQGGELSPAIVGYWRVSQFEFLLQRQRCADAFELAERQFTSAAELELNPATRGLLREVVDGAAKQCDCADTTSGPMTEPGCPTVGRVRAALDAAPVTESASP
ncbi:MAG: protein kinase [Xanthomonadales bacterium]|nr:protein kinase [Xanthomonadales bacterium]